MLVEYPVDWKRRQKDSSARNQRSYKRNGVGLQFDPSQASFTTKRGQRILPEETFSLV